MPRATTNDKAKYKMMAVAGTIGGSAWCCGWVHRGIRVDAFSGFRLVSRFRVDVRWASEWVVKKLLLSFLSPHSGVKAVAHLDAMRQWSAPLTHRINICKCISNKHEVKTGQAESHPSCDQQNCVEGLSDRGSFRDRTIFTHIQMIPASKSTPLQQSFINGPLSIDHFY